MIDHRSSDDPRRRAATDRQHLVNLLSHCSPKQLPIVLKAAADLLPPELLAAIMAKREARLRAEIADLTKRSQTNHAIWRENRRACYKRGYEDGYNLRLHDLPWPARSYVARYERVERCFSLVISYCSTSVRQISRRCHHLLLKR